MWLFRGAQSAVFYYAACTPCAASIHQRKRKRDAAKTHREPPPTTNTTTTNNNNSNSNDNDIVTDQPPVVFQQPFPFTTNSYWEEEIALGPGPPARRAGRRNNSNANANNSHKNRKNDRKKKKANTNGQADSIGSPVGAGVAQPESPESTLQNGMGALAGAVTGVLEDLVPSRKEIGDRWNRIRYQREDEELWGGGGSGNSSPVGGGGHGPEVKGSSVGLSGRGRADTASSAKYYVAKNPAVNDLHPPVVCGPVSRAETRWMLQPPPSAKVMAGKVRSMASVSVRDGRQGSFEKATVSGGAGRTGNGPRDKEEGEGEGIPGSYRTGRRQQLQIQGDGQLDGCWTAHAPSQTQQELPPKDSLRSRRMPGKPSPILVGTDNFLALSPSSADDAVLLSPRPVFAPITRSTDRTPTHHHHRHHRRHHHNTIPSSENPSSGPPTPWQWPRQRTEDSKKPPSQSRPTSKATADSGKAFALQQQQQHQQQQPKYQYQQEMLHTAWPSSTLDIAMKHHELVRSVHVEVSSPETAFFYDIDDDCDDDYDDGVRPWRWSMDI
ncbi:hypothetical protein AJ78_06054 [Emergomyces pasteurianus Ep9510]|uniref:Uncharacterized protein n=1 Tax=Emergomyces pasteurianus Ep9510 TaxID=1447872 RepID=A0A1J9Q021_9EURO|nr:hypothetical protein AJ78_06054 [Emergomyces pasteurianus Ep9510]